MEENCVKAFLWIACAYFSGAVPFGFLVGRLRGIDVRTVGSGNIGATNVYRCVGKKWGLLVFLLDFLKGFVPTMSCVVFEGAGNLAVSVGFISVVGHTLTVFMKFRGGKGVATAFGMLMALCPLPALGAFVVFAVTVWLSHYISLGSCLAAAALGAGIWFATDLVSLRIMVTLLAVFVVFKHRSNIKRLVQGRENRIY